MRHVTVRQLQIFAEAAEALSFARVAERLHLTPAAVSFQIKQIEAQAGCALFERIGKAARLTEAGSALLGYARQVLQALTDADRAMTALQGPGSGRVTIGLVTTATYFVPHVLARFQALFPEIAIRLADGNRAQILDLMGKGQIDLAVMGQPPEDSDVAAEAFADHPSVIVAAPEHRLAGRARLAATDLAGEPFILREDGSGTRALMERFFPGLGLKPRAGMVTSSNETIKQAVMAGMGLALISRHTIGMELGQGRLVVLPVAGFPLMRSWFIGHRRTMQLLPAHQRLRAFLIERSSGVIDALEADYRAGAKPPQRQATARTGAPSSPATSWAGRGALK